MAKLTDLGFSKDVIAETVVSTYNADGSPNAAPMGVTLIDEQHVAINIYNSSTTLANIRARRCAVVNLTGDIESYYRTAFKEANPNGKLTPEWFTRAEVVEAPRMRSAEASLEVSVDELVAVDKERTRALFTVKLAQATPLYPRVYCRAFGATLEAIVHATRVKALANDEAERKRVEELLKKIQSCSDVVDRVAPNSSYSAVMADLTKRTAAWGPK